MSKESDWGKFVLICMIILAIIALFKFLFWISIIVIFVGIIWIIVNLFSEYHDLSWIPVVMIIGGILLAVISYQIGYQFEKSETGKPIVDSAKTIVDADKTIKEVEQNATNQILDATQRPIGEITK